MVQYQPGIPTGLVNLDVDYQNIQDNFQQLDTTYGVDHYPYSDPNPTNGFHNKVTTPGFIDSPPTGLPPTTTTYPVLYGFQQYGALGLLQYSRGPNNAVPTPLTNINSTAAATPIPGNTSINLIDFTGISLAIFNVYAFQAGGILPPNITATVYWIGTGFIGLPVNSSGSGNILQLKATTAVPLSVYWTISFERIQ